MVAQHLPRSSFGRRSWLRPNLGFVLPSMAAVFILLLLEPAVVNGNSPRALQDSTLVVQGLCSSSTFDLWKEGESKRASGTVVFTLPDERPSPPRWNVESAALQSNQEEGQPAQPLAVIGGQQEHSQTRFSSPPTSSPSESSKKAPFPRSSWIREHLGSKSPYPHEEKKAKSPKDFPPGYELVQLHVICRHGTRYPSSSNAIAIKTLSEKLKQVEVPGFEWLKTWRADPLYPATKGNLLAPQGDSDMYRIGRRFAERYKDFLDQHPYDANTYQFQSSGKSRCRQSAYGFTVGFLQGRHAAILNTTEPKMESEQSPVQPVDISTVPIGMDTELAVKYACPRWSENVDHQPKVVYEARTYKENILPELAEQLSIRFAPEDRLGLVNFTTKDVETIHTACGFEVSLYENDQTWCQLLRLASPLKGLLSKGNNATEEDIKSTFMKLEISSDLAKYYTYGPGVPFNRHLGCKLATSLLKSIELVLAPGEGTSPVRRTGDRDVDEEGTPHLFRGHFKFGHSETIMFFSSFLGLYNQKGARLTATMTPEQYKKRKFKTSDFSPFAANMAFEVYKPKPAKSSPGKWRLSDENESPPRASKGLVRMLVNEKSMLIPGCEVEYCEWATFKSLLVRAGAGCDFETCCKSLGSPLADAAPLTWMETLRRITQDEDQDKSDEECLAVDPITE